MRFIKQNVLNQTLKKNDKKSSENKTFPSLINVLQSH